MKNFKKFYVVLVLIVGTLFITQNVSASGSDYQTITLSSGWNIISTPKVLLSHEFSVVETSSNFDIYLLDPTSSSGWQTMQGAGQTEFQPLFSYFINNKTEQNQTLKLNYNFSLTPSQRLFQRTLQPGWNTVGIASPSYALSQGSTSADTDNPSSILNSITSVIGQVIDFTNGNSSLDSPFISDNWLSKTVTDVNSLNDFRELKGYGVFITTLTNNYLGSQNLLISEDIVPVIILNGDTTVNIVVGDSYTDAGATASDNIDGDITSNIVTINPVNTNTVGTYTITYNVSDSFGNSAQQVTRTVTVRTPGTVTASKNVSMADATTVNSTGVVGATNVKIASFVITAGAGEAVTATQIVVGDLAGGDAFGSNFQNLTLRNGSSTSTPIATVQGTLSTTDGANYTFSLSPSVTIAAGAQYVVDVYADILTGAAGFATAMVGLEYVSVSATGVNTSGDASDTNAASLQNVVIAGNGSLVVTVNASTPAAAQLVMGETGQTLAMLDFAAGSAEDVDVSVITVTDTSSFAGSLSNIKLYDGATLLGTIASFSGQSNGTATFNLASDWTIPKNTTKTLTIKADVNSYGSAVSGGAHVINVASDANITTRGSQSGVAIDESVTVGTISHNVYRTKVTAEKGSASPSGSSVVAANSNVLEFTVAVNSAYDAVVNAVAVTMSGSMTATGTGNAFLYKSTDLSTALATEAYQNDLVSVSAAVDGQELQVTGSSGDWIDIPVGATVLVNDTSVSSTAFLRGEVAAVSATVITINVVGTISGYAGIDVGVTYAPMQPGVGKVYFGAQTTLGADVATGATTITVTSTDGFAVGDTVVVKGYSAAGVETTSTAGGVIATIPSATSITLSALTVAATIDYNYLATAANAITNSQNSSAIAYTGLINTSGQVVSAGTTATFVVKGDTTSTGTAGTTATLRADLASVGDVNWDDKTNYGVTTITKNLPVTGGTLTYTY